VDEEEDERVGAGYGGEKDIVDLVEEVDGEGGDWDSYRMAW
jgi:hypothetical protein